MVNIEKLRKNFESRHYLTSYFETAAEAADYLCQNIHNTSVGIGGSITVEELGLYERLRKDNKVFWHWKETDVEAARLDAQDAAVYICSANGVSENGEIVNIDGTGNRLAATMFCKEKVYIVIGVNKIEPDLEKAIWRARNIASPLNAKRLGVSTPCAVAEETRCYDCLHPQKICGGLLILWRKMKGVKECEIVIVGENLGY